MARKKRKGEELTEARHLAYEYRLDGMTYVKIGERLGVSYKQAWEYVQHVMKAAQEETPENVSQIREAELARLDSLLVGLAPMAHVGNVGAVTAYLKVMERRAKLLGLDAPAKSEVKIEDWRTDAIRAIQEGKLGYDDLLELFDEDMAARLLTEAKLAGI